MKTLENTPEIIDVEKESFGYKSIKMPTHYVGVSGIVESYPKTEQDWEGFDYNTGKIGHRHG